MPLESATYISDLVSTNPAGSDQFKDGDNHIRLIKAALKATFPNIDGPVTVDQDTLNQGGIPTGGIINWYGLASAIPAGWGLCDGSTYAKLDGSGNITSPNLVSRFVKGWNAPSETTRTGGAATHSHTITIAGTALSTAQLPAHSHTVNDPGHTHTGTAASNGTHLHGMGDRASSGAIANGGGTFVMMSNSGGASGSVNTDSGGAHTHSLSIANNDSNITLSNAGSGQTHTHTASETAASNDPSYYLLAYIIKL